jgi:hypothetical protein
MQAAIGGKRLSYAVKRLHKQLGNGGLFVNSKYQY